MSKLLVTRLGGHILTALVSDGRPLELSMEPEKEGLLVGDIYLAQVKSIAKNINAAFLDMGGGQMGYLPLEKEPPLLADGSGRLCEGSVVLVQIEREAVKTKAPVMSGRLNLPGSGIVMMYPKKGVSFSQKIRDEEWKRKMRELLEAHLPEGAGIIVRTNGYSLSPEQLVEAVKKQAETLKGILNVYQYRSCFSRLYRGTPSYINALLSHGAGKDTEEILTDDSELYEEMREWAEKEEGDLPEKIRLYSDPQLPLKKLYRLETEVEQALKERVWLKSGGYLVIQPTEALTVIDVNTGKNEGHKKKEETVWQTNKEAAGEIALQLRLRNLSGIILVDFIDMKEREKREELLELLRTRVKADPIRTEVVDMTALNLVEITRKRVRKPLHEQVREE